MSTEKDYGFHWHKRMTSRQSEKVKILQDKDWHILCLDSHGSVLLYHNDTTNQHRIPR